MNTPILLIGFNRPEMIAKSFNCIAAQNPEKLYVSIDGPRKNVPTDFALIEEVRKIVQNVTWQCKVEYLFSKQNKGAEVTVSNAVSWVFKSEETVIVVEDDIVASESFFRFCEDILLRYRNEEKVYMISGGQFTPMPLSGNEDYLFAVHGHTGTGWATWKRAWKHFNLYVDVTQRNIDVKHIRRKVNCKEKEYYISDLIKNMLSMGVGGSAWDICWTFIRFDEQGLTVIPRVNLTSNIGVLGLHSNGETKHHYRPFDKDFVAKIHPEKVTCNKEYDIYHAQSYLFKRNIYIERIRRSRMYAILRKLKRIII